MKLNEKGFTLMEILGVVAILLAISLIAIPSGVNMKNRKNKELYNKVVENITNSAKLYVEMNNREQFETYHSNCFEVTLKQLYTEGILKLPIKNPIENKNFDINSKVSIELVGSNIEYTFPSGGCP